MESKRNPWLRVMWLSASLALAACGGDGPTIESVSLQVVAGSLSSASVDGPKGTHLLVPAGATSGDVLITLSTLPPSRPPPGNALVVGTPMRLEPEGYVFSKAVELTIPIPASSLPPGSSLTDVVVMRASQDSDVFVALPTQPAGNAVVVQTEHFSDFFPVIRTAPDGGTSVDACGDGACQAADQESCTSCPLDCGLCLPDARAPALTSASPADGATGVAADSTIVFTFDEPLLMGSVNTATVDVRVGTAPVAGTVTLAGSTVSFTPTANFPPSTTVTVNVAGVADLAGNTFTLGAPFTFVTASVPALVSASPANGSNINPYAKFDLTWDVTPDASTLSMQAADGPCTGSVRVSADAFTTCLGGVVWVNGTTNTVRIETALAIPSSATVAIDFTATALATNGFSLSAFGGYSVTTGYDTYGPRVLKITPADTATGVGVNAPIVIEFDEPIEPIDVTAANIDVGDGEVSYSGTLTLNGNVVTYTPDAPHGQAVTRNVTVRNIRDLLGNGMNGQFTSTFETVHGLSFVAVSPSYYAKGVHPRQDLVVTLDHAPVVATLTMQTADGPCSGSVVVTPDYGSTCLGGTFTLSNGNTTLTIQPTSSMALSGNYSVGLTNAVLDAAGLTLDNGTATEFKVSPVNGFAYTVRSSGSRRDGLIGGIAGADALCDPSGTGASKAFLMGATRYACTTANCSTGDESLDWVLRPNTAYMDYYNGNLLFQTDATLPIVTAFPIPGALGSGMLVNVMTGATAGWQHDAANDCVGWTSNAVTDFMSVGWSDALDVTALSNGTVDCSNVVELFCVDQPPAVLPALH